MRKAKRLIKRLCRQLTCTYRCKIILDKEECYLCGKTYRNNSNFADCIQIGVKEIWDMSSGSELVPDDMFLCVVTNLYHEICHVNQMVNLYRYVRTEDNLYMALVDLACSNNRTYYFDTMTGGTELRRAYYYNPVEIYAEWEGVNGLHEYLHQTFRELSEEDINNLTLVYVNYKTDTKKENNDYAFDYYIPNGHYCSWEDILTAFKNAFHHSKYVSNQYFAYADCDDVAMQLMTQTAALNEKCRQIFLDMPEPKGLNQHRMIAAVTLKVFPEELKKYPILKDMNLDLDYILENPVTEINTLEKM